MAARFPGFSLRLTRWGGMYLVLILLVGGAAVNTGNNALMMLFGIGLGAYVVSGAWSRQVLGRLELELSVPRDLHAGGEVPVVATMVNCSRFFPGAGLVVRGAEGEIVLFEPWLAAGAVHRRTVVLKPQRRGRWPVGPWRLEVLLPLGFFLKSKRVLEGLELLVYPRLLSSGEMPLAGGRRPSERSGGRRGREGEVTQLRPFREGDETRQLHWKQTARQQRPIVVERQRTVPNPEILVLSTAVDDPEDPVVREMFELEVSRVATAALTLLRRGVPVGLRLGERLIPPVSGLAGRASLLVPLSEVQPTARPEDRAAVAEGERG